MEIAICCRDAESLFFAEERVFCSKEELIYRISSGEKYDLICIDLSIENVSGLVKQIRKLDKETMLFFGMDYGVASEKNYFYYFRNKKEHRVLLNSILYFESRGRYIIIHLKDDTERVFYGKLNLVEEKVRDYRLFHRIHQSYLVNRQHISKMTGKSMILSDGKSLNVSRGKRAVLAEYFSN